MIIYKYNLGLNFGMQARGIPKHARFLSVGLQGDNIVLWALVDKTLPQEPVMVLMAPTGQDWSDTSMAYTEFIGTVQVGGIVYHVFIKREP